MWVSLLNTKTLVCHVYGKLNFIKLASIIYLLDVAVMTIELAYIYLFEKIRHKVLLTTYLQNVARIENTYHYSTTNKLFLVNPSPIIGNSGDRCHSPSTKNLISYLQNNICFWVRRKIYRLQVQIKSFSKLTKMVPSRPEHQCCWKPSVRTSIFRW